MEIDLMTSKATGIAIAILCELQGEKENIASAITVERKMSNEDELISRLTHYERKTATRQADFKRLLVACTKLIVNES